MELFFALLGQTLFLFGSAIKLNTFNKNLVVSTAFFLIKIIFLAFIAPNNWPYYLPLIKIYQKHNL